MISRARLRLGVQEWGVGDVVVENDYVLGWLLWGIGSDPTLREQWVFNSLWQNPRGVRPAIHPG